MVLERNTVRKGLVNRATLGDLCKSLALRFVKITGDVNVARDFFDESSIRYVTVFAVVGMHA